LAWQKLLAPYSKADPVKAWFQLLSTAALFAANWLLMLWSLSGPYWLTLLLVLPAAGLQIRLFIFQHDCGHGSFFRQRKLNNVVGATIGVLMLTPYNYWRRTHAIHHATSGDLDNRSFGDVETLTVAEYEQLSRIGKLKYRLYRNPLILLTVGPFYQFVIKHRLPLDIPRSWKREWRSVMGTNLAIAGALTLVWLTIGFKSFLLVQAPITLVSAMLGMWLFYVQHQFEDTYWREHPEWDYHQAALEGSSFYDLPKILHWFTGNIGYHHIHHLASRVPNYHLPKCFREVPEMQHVTRLKIVESLRCLWLSLWDTEQGKLVSFRTARQRSAATAA
jgi:omega-6 fatty acid desaturase (delta-12 desaturase)